jgi:hypothetical protein
MLADVKYNQKLLKEGINKVSSYMNTLKSETTDNMNVVSANVEIEGHVLRVNNAINSLLRKLGLLTDSAVNAQRGVLQPQVISPVTLMDTLIKSTPAFPKVTFYHSL